MKKSLAYLLILILAVSLFISSPCLAEEKCIYIEKQGVIKIADNLNNIPVEYRKTAKCTKTEKGMHLAKPDEINLGNTTRREELNSPVGKIILRWPRSAETLFGRTPSRAMSDAAKTVSKTIRTSAFPTHIQNMNLEWNIVFMDEKLPETQIPAYLISNCHPGWMTPPANIYIVAQRVAAGCTNNKISLSNADKALTEVLVHEMGHSLEYHILGQNNPPDRMRAEGFATWFEMHAAQYSSILDRKELIKRNAAAAAFAIKNSPNVFAFSGSGEDYARSSMYFSAIEDRFGLQGILAIYSAINNEGIDMFSAANKKLHLKRDQLEKEQLKYIEKNFSR